MSSKAKSKILGCLASFGLGADMAIGRELSFLIYIIIGAVCLILLCIALAICDTGKGGHQR